MVTIEQKEARKKAQALREQEICSRYNELRSLHPEATAYTIFGTIADHYRKLSLELPGTAFPTTDMGIRNVIIKHKLYTPKSKRYESCREA